LPERCGLPAEVEGELELRVADAVSLRTFAEAREVSEVGARAGFERGRPASERESSDADAVIAVPALVYAVGAYGFFALPYTIIVYPIVFMIMPPGFGTPRIAPDT
jgi:hypothetical protein